jgi:hypothetical protein
MNLIAYYLQMTHQDQDQTISKIIIFLKSYSWKR